MVKHRVILIVLAVVLIAVLYSLPRIVVDNTEDPDMEVRQNTDEDASGRELTEEDMISRHSFELSATEKAKIEELKSDFLKNTGDRKALLADSIASMYESFGRYDSAARYYEFLAVNNPKAENYEKAGNAFYESFSFAMDRDKASQLGEKARFYYNKLLDEQPGRLDLRNKIAMTFVSSANPMQGIMMLRQILEEDPENMEANFNMGMLSVQSGQYERAKEYFKKLVELDPRNVKGQFYLGLSLYELGEKEEARKQFELVKSMDDDPAVIATAEGYLKELK